MPVPCSAGCFLLYCAHSLLELAVQQEHPTTLSCLAPFSGTLCPPSAWAKGNRQSLFLPILLLSHCLVGICHCDQIKPIAPLFVSYLIRAGGADLPASKPLLSIKPAQSPPLRLPFQEERKQNWTNLLFIRSLSPY